MNDTNTYDIHEGWITARRRDNDWIAYREGDSSTWESGRTEAEAIGKLVVSLSLNA